MLLIAFAANFIAFIAFIACGRFLHSLANDSAVGGWVTKPTLQFVMSVESMLDQPEVDPGSALGRSCPGSTLDRPCVDPTLGRSWIGPGSILDQPWSGLGSALHQSWIGLDTILDLPQIDRGSALA